MQATVQTWQAVHQQYDWFQQMRATHPVWRDETSGCWHIFRYDDVKNILSDYTHFSSDFRRFVPARSTPIAPSLISMDPPQHRKYRALISPLFTPRAIAALSERITAIVQGLLDHVRPLGQMDVIEDLAYPLPTTVIAEMLGVPIADRPLFRRWADELFSGQLSDAEIVQNEETETTRRMRPVIQEMKDYFTRMLEERRRQPCTDLMSDLLAAEVDGNHLDLEETISFCFLLLIAGHVTTTNLLGLAILCFTDHPDVMQQLRQEPDLMPGAIEEVLRYTSLVWRIGRMTTTEIVIDDTHIPANTIIFGWLASANHDPAQFPDPESFDIRRSPNNHVAFGHGIHFCIGAPLARLEASIALPMMLAQLPQIHRAPEAPVVLLDTRNLLGIKRLPVTFLPTSPDRNLPVGEALR